MLFGLQNSKISNLERMLSSFQVNSFQQSQLIDLKDNEINYLKSENT